MSERYVTTLPVFDRPSPNINSREGLPVSILVLHYTAMAAQASIDWLANPVSKVSCHYVVDEAGRITRMVDEADRAWHAGQGNWRGLTNINGHSVGIEIVNPGHELGYVPFPEPQMQAVVALSRDIIQRHAIARRDVIGHSDMAPLRKTDPGELFDWERLAKAGIGVMPPRPRYRSKGVTLTLGDDSPDVATLQADLTRYGYGLEQTGRYDFETQAVVTAFQRHFRRSRVDGLADPQTRAILAALLRKL